MAEKNAHRYRRRQDEKRALREAGSWEIAHVIRSTAEMIDSFHGIRLWEHIKCGNRVKENSGKDPYSFTKRSEPVHSRSGCDRDKYEP